MGALDNPFKKGDLVQPLFELEDDSLHTDWIYTVAEVRGNLVGVHFKGRIVYRDCLHFTYPEGADEIEEVIDAGSKVKTYEGSYPISDEELTKDFAKIKDAKTGTDKRRFSLFPLEALQAALDVIESGNIDLPWRDAYPIDSWKRKSGDYKRRYLDALSRHLFDYIKGENFTEDTGLYTMAAVLVNAAFLLQFEIEELGIYPSNDGKEEIKRMKEGKKAYEED